MGLDSTINIVVISISFVLYFFFTQSLWRKRNYLIWLFILLTVTIILYFISSQELLTKRLKELVPSFLWLIISFILDKIFRSIRISNQAMPGPSFLVFTVYDIAIPRDQFDKKLTDSLRRIDKISSIVLVVLMYGLFALMFAF